MGAVPSLGFPFLLGRAFIEAVGHNKDAHNLGLDFPSFSEGLSLRLTTLWLSAQQRHFPFLFGRAFIEAPELVEGLNLQIAFPFLFGGAFIEARGIRTVSLMLPNFPSYLEGLSLR